MEALIVFIIFGSLCTTVLGFRYMRHREKLAELEVQRARALAEAEQQRALAPARQELAKELLEAYEEANQGLRSD